MTVTRITNGPDRWNRRRRLTRSRCRRGSLEWHGDGCRPRRGGHNHARCVHVGSGLRGGHRRAGADYVPRMKGAGSVPQPAPHRSPRLIRPVTPTAATALRSRQTRSRIPSVPAIPTAPAAPRIPTAAACGEKNADPAAKSLHVISRRFTPQSYSVATGLLS